MMGRPPKSVPTHNHDVAAWPGSNPELAGQGQVAHCHVQLTSDTICPQVLCVGDKINIINDTFWTLRVEATPRDQLWLRPCDRLIHVYHVTPDTQRYVSLAA